MFLVIDSGDINVANAWVVQESQRSNGRSVQIDFRCRVNTRKLTSSIGNVKFKLTLL